VLPERHDGVLQQTLLLSPQFAPAIKEAQRRIADSEELQAMLRRSQGLREQQAIYKRDRTSRMSSVEMLRRASSAFYLGCVIAPRINPILRL
jgi:hypothetical protein